MKEFTSHALNVATGEGARYADIRIIDHREQVLSVKNGNVDGIGDQFSQGFGVRVLVGDSWGFAASAYLDRTEIERVARLAVDVARASAQVPGERVDLGSPVKSTGTYTTPVEIDPFSVSLEQKLDLLFRADQIMRRNPAVRVSEANRSEERRGGEESSDVCSSDLTTPVEIDPFSVSLEQKLDLLFRADQIMRRNPAVRVSEANTIAVRNQKFFSNTDGAFVEQIIYESGGAIAATAVTDTEVQIRSHPNSFRY